MPDTLPVPPAVRAAAREANALVARGYKGGTATGRARGRQLARGTISLDDAIEMRAWFARHVSTSYPSYRRFPRDADARRDAEGRRGAWRGAVAWQLWGGTPAYAWLLDAKMQARLVTHGARTGRVLTPYVTPVAHVVSEPRA